MNASFNSNNYEEVIMSYFECHKSTQSVELVQHLDDYDGEFTDTQVLVTGRKGNIISFRYNMRKGLVEAYSKTWPDIFYSSDLRDLISNVKEMIEFVNKHSSQRV
jgi:hypothetical protein